MEIGQGNDTKENKRGTRLGYFAPYDIHFPAFVDCANHTYYEEWEVYLLGSLGGASSLAIIVLNSLIYLAFIFKPKLRRLPCARIIWHVMVPSDMLIGFIAFPLLTMWEMCGMGWPMAKWVCDLWTWADYMGCNVSKYSVAVVALERFFAIKWPLKHKAFMSARKEWAMVFGIWLFCGLWLTAEMVVWPYINGFRQAEPEGICDHPLYYEVALNIVHRILAWYIPFIVTLVSYIGLGFAVSNAVRKMANLSQGKDDKKRMAGVRKTFRITSLVIGSFAICWFPYQIVEVLRVFKLSGSGKYSPIIFSYFLSFENSLVNPISYFFMDVKFRDAVAEMLCCRQPGAAKKPNTTVTAVSTSTAVDSEKKIDDEDSDD